MLCPVCVWLKVAIKAQPENSWPPSWLLCSLLFSLTCKIYIPIRPANDFNSSTELSQLAMLRICLDNKSVSSETNADLTWKLCSIYAPKDFVVMSWTQPSSLKSLAQHEVTFSAWSGCSSATCSDSQEYVAVQWWFPSQLCGFPHRWFMTTSWMADDPLKPWQHFLARVWLKECTRFWWKPNTRTHE